MSAAPLEILEERGFMPLFLAKQSTGSSRMLLSVRMKFLRIPHMKLFNIILGHNLMIIPEKMR